MQKAVVLYDPGEHVWAEVWLRWRGAKHAHGHEVVWELQWQEGPGQPAGQKGNLEGVCMRLLGLAGPGCSLHKGSD